MPSKESVKQAIKTQIIKMEIWKCLVIQSIRMAWRHLIIPNRICRRFWGSKRKCTVFRSKIMTKILKAHRIRYREKCLGLTRNQLMNFKMLNWFKIQVQSQMSWGLSLMKLLYFIKQMDNLGSWKVKQLLINNQINTTKTWV